MDEGSRLLGIDYGEARIGVAVSDPLRLFARPHAVLKAGGGGDLERLRSLVEELGVARIVVGLPTDSQGGIGSQALAVIHWARQLAGITDVPIAFWDESYSSEAAQAISKKPRRRQAPGKRETVDDLAAAVILQDYLDAGGGHHEPGTPLQAFSHLP